MNTDESKHRLLDDYGRDGYVLMQHFVAGEALEELQKNVDRFIDEVVPTMPPEHVFYEDKDDPTTLKQLQHMGDYDPWFHDQFTSGPFRQIAEVLLRGPVVPRNMQYFNKPAGVGQATPPHQDGYYFRLEPCEALTMWFALEDVDEETGCVRYVPGSHKLGMREHGRTQTLGFSQGIVDYPTDEDLANERAFPARPGDLLATKLKPRTSRTRSTTTRHTLCPSSPTSTPVSVTLKRPTCWPRR